MVHRTPSKTFITDVDPVYFTETMCKCLQVYDWRGNCWEAWRTGIVYKNILPCGFGMFCWTKYLRCYATYSGGCRKEVPGTGPQISHNWISSVLQWPCSQWFQYPLRIPPNWKAVLCLLRPGFFPWPVIPSNALHWLSRMPDEILDKNSPAWNKGRGHHTGGPYEVAHAYAAQFDKDMRNFLNARWDLSLSILTSCFVWYSGIMPHGNGEGRETDYTQILS